MLRMQGTVREIALDLVCADGRRLPVLVNSILERSPEGHPVVVRTAVFDATERREYERELLRAKQTAEQSEARARQLARTLQETLIPPTPPEVPGLEVAAAYRPAGDGEEVGGDFYDVIQLGPQEWAATIGDVCGKGAEAAVVTALVRYTIRAAAIRLAAPGQALRIVNQVLLRPETDRFCTALLMKLELDDDGWQATLSSGGHPLPLLIRSGQDLLRNERPGPLLGVMEDGEYADIQVRLVPGDLLVLFTDGVTEGRRGKEFYGEERLADLVRRHTDSAVGVVDALLSDLMEFQSQLPRDDIALVAVRVPDSPD
jgi:sigma-B regulation protein RsbU (phosphoserine phosphatase)